MAFLITFTYYITDSDGASNLTIQGYILNTNSIKTNLLGPAILLIAVGWLNQLFDGQTSDFI